LFDLLEPGDQHVLARTLGVERVATRLCFDSAELTLLLALIGSFGAEWHAPSVFWYIGATNPDAYDKAEQAGRVTQDIPTNHSPNFAPVIHPTLKTGVEAMVVAARAWLSSWPALPRETASGR
jgi:hypothetical protein